MAELAKVKICFLLEPEIRRAAKALRALHDEIKAGTDKDGATLTTAINAASAALWGADDESMCLMLTSAPILGVGASEPEVAG
jgi:hypothetical protein